MKKCALILLIVGGILISMVGCINNNPDNPAVPVPDTPGTTDEAPVNSKVIRLEVSSRVKNRNDSSTWKIVSEGQTAADDVWVYRKSKGMSADNSRLTISTNGATTMSFDVFVNSATDGEFPLMLDGGASFISITDESGNKIDPQKSDTVPYATLREGIKYSIKLDFSDTCGYAALKIRNDKAAILTYSNISFEHIDGAENRFFRQVIFKSQDEYGYFSWPSVAKLDGDRMIAVSSGYRLQHLDPYGKIVGWISEDNGMTWGEPFVIADTILDDRDGGVIYWDGKIFVTWFTRPNRAYSSDPRWAEWCSKITAQEERKHLGGNISVSEDGGKTWSEPKLIDVFTPNGIITSPDGNLAYIGYSDHTYQRGNFTKVGMITSTDGINWSDVTVIADAQQKIAYEFEEPYGVYAEDGTLIVHLRTKTGIYQCERAPGSDTFSDFRLISRAAETPSHLLKLRSGALFMTYGYRAPNYGIRARVSYDNGVNWSKEIIVTAEAFEWDMGYANTLEFDDGRLFTIFYQKELVSDRSTGIMQVIWELPEKPSGMQTITFDYNDGRPITTASGEFGTAVGTIAKPVRDGYSFAGWYVDEACTVPYIINRFTETLTVYAKWIGEHPIPEANSSKYMRPATASEISASGYSGNGNVYLYSKPVGELAKFGGPATSWIDVSEYNSEKLTFSFYLQDWFTEHEKLIEIAGISDGRFVFENLSIVKASDGSPVKFTKGENGYYVPLEKGVWYTATIDIKQTDTIVTFCWIARGMKMLIADVQAID